MEIIAFDDEKLALQDLVETIETTIPESKVHSFQSSDKALEFAGVRNVHIAFLDIVSDGLSGIELAKKFKDIRNDINIIFVTNYSEYALDAFFMYASGYVLKPITKEKILEQLENLRNPAPYPDEKRIRVQTFGNFQVFCDNEPLHFSRKKSKELFAYLVNKRGSGCGSKEIATILYEEVPYGRSVQSQVQTAISTMIKTFENVGEFNIISKKHNSVSVNVDEIECDYYRFLKGDVQAINSYSGEYMTNYEWADFVIGYLDEKSGLYKRLW